MSPPKSTIFSLKGWLIRKTKKKNQIFLYKNNKNTTKKKRKYNNKLKKYHNYHRNNPHITTNAKQLTLEGTVLVHEVVKKYGHPYSSSMLKGNILLVHSQNIQNMPVEA